MIQRLTIATRGSKLALWQANWVKEALVALTPGLEVTLTVIKTKGDRILDVPLAKFGDKGLFTKEIDRAMLEGGIELAVHSLKDLPSRLEPGITLASVPAREQPWDAWVSSSYPSLDVVPAGATVLTGSLRRRAQLLAWRPDLEVQDLRGNVQTRLQKIGADGIAGGVLALAGLTRLGLADQARAVLPLDRFVPAVGQGALAITARADDEASLGLARRLEDHATRVAVEGERGFLFELEGGCQVPLGCAGALEGDGLHLIGFVASLDGRLMVRGEARGSAAEARALGQGLARELLGRGARPILDAVLAVARG